MTVMLHPEPQFMCNCSGASGACPAATFKNQARKAFWFSGNGGGRHYGDNMETGKYIDRNSGARFVYLDANTQPTSFYGLNLELGKSGACGVPTTNVEIAGSTAGARIYGVKREGTAGTLHINASSNVGIFGVGAMSAAIDAASVAFVRVTGTSNNYVVGTMVVRDNQTANSPQTMLSEAITGLTSVSASPWPNGISYAKRGVLDDTPFVDTAAPPASPIFLSARVDVSDRVDVCFTIFDNTAMLPSATVTGMTVTVNSVGKTITSSTRSANNCYSLNFAIGTITLNTQTVSVSYTPGNITAGGTGTPAALAFTGQTAINTLSPNPAPIYTQNHFAFRTLIGLEDQTTSPWYTNETGTAEDIPLLAVPGGGFRVTIQVGVTAAAASPQTLRLYWDENSSGIFVPLTNSCATDPICFADAPDLPDSYDFAAQQLTSGGGTFVPGALLESVETQAPVTLTAGTETEMEIGIALKSTVTSGNRYRLRLYTGTGTPFTTYTQTPLVTVMKQRSTQRGGGTAQ